MAKILKDTTLRVHTLRDFRHDQNPVGGIIGIFKGDFRQILPVIPRGKKINENYACLKNDGNAAIFSETQMNIGNGTLQKNFYNSNPSFF